MEEGDTSSAPVAAGPVHSSMYRNLRTNLPREVMSYSDFPFTRAWRDARRFCGHDEVGERAPALLSLLWLRDDAHEPCLHAPDVHWDMPCHDHKSASLQTSNLFSLPFGKEALQYYHFYVPERLCKRGMATGQRVGHPVWSSMRLACGVACQA